MSSLDRLVTYLRKFPFSEEERKPYLQYILDTRAHINSLKSEMCFLQDELKAIRKMHERQPIMPFYNEVPSSKICTNNIYELKLAVQGTVEQEADRPVIAIGIREYGQPKNYAHQVWVDKFHLLFAEDRKALINYILQDMGKQMERLFDKEETNGV